MPDGVLWCAISSRADLPIGFGRDGLSGLLWPAFRICSFRLWIVFAMLGRRAKIELFLKMLEYLENLLILMRDQIYFDFNEH